MPNTRNTRQVTRRLGDIRRRNRPNQRRNHNSIRSQDTPETAQAPTASGISTSAPQSSASNLNAESQSMHGQQGALQEASVAPGQISLREPVVLGDREPIAPQTHTDELEVISDDELADDDTGRVCFEMLQDEVKELQVSLEKEEACLFELRLHIAQPPRGIKRIIAENRLFLIRINRLNIRVGKLQSRIDRLPACFTRLQTYLSDLPINFKSVHAPVDILLIRIERSKTHIEQLQARMDRIPRQLAILKTEVAESQQEFTALQEEIDAQNANSNNGPVLLPDFNAVPFPGRPVLNALLAHYKNRVWEMRKSSIDDLLESVDGSWENLDSCFCLDPYEHVMAEGESHVPVRMKECGHVFGEFCIVLWLKEQYTCPMCRNEVYLPETVERYMMDLRRRWE